MNKKYLLSSVTAGIALLYANQGTAQCVSTQDCTALGYTESSCPNGGVKCPFGNKWMCINSGITPEQCTELGFTQTCTGTNQTGGGSKVCNGKYNYCTCADGYVWQNGACVVKTCPVPCTIGTLYYSDGTCSDKLESSKTLLGVVIYEKSASQMGWIMTVKPIQTGIYWSTEYVDIPGLTNITSESSLTDIQASCTNTDIITAYGNSSKYPAAWAAKNYKPTGTPSGKSWCLPSGGLLKNALANSTNFAKVNAGITIAGGTILGNVSGGHEYVWSSSEYSNYHAWGFSTNTSGSFNMTNSNKDYYYYYGSVRPVMEF